MNETLLRGEQLLRSGQPVAAEVLFDRVVHSAPHSAEALTWRGICRNQLKEYSAAAADFQAAIALDKSDYAAHYNLSLSLLRLGKTDAAIEQLEWVIDSHPDNIQPLYNLAVLLEGKGAYKEAADHLEHAHALQPGDKGITAHLLADMLKLRQTDGISALVDDLSDAATPPELQLMAGSSLLDSLRFIEAERLLASARERSPNLDHVNNLLARAMIGADQGAAAVKVLGDQPSDPGDESQRLYLLGLGYLAMGQTESAKANFESAHKLAPGDPRSLYQLAMIAELLPDQRASASVLLESAHALEPENATYSLALARILLAADRPDEATTLLLRTPAASEIAAERATLLGVALAATHRVAEAIVELRKAVAQDSRSDIAEDLLGFCLMQQGDYAEAASAYGKASEVDPRRALYARDAALAFDRAGKLEQATLFAERARSLDEGSAEDHALMGKLYAAEGRNAEAIEELSRAVTLDAKIDSAYYLLARTYQQMGDSEQAKAWSLKLSALKKEQQAEFDLRKKDAADNIRSSALLGGGTLSAQPSPRP